MNKSTVCCLIVCMLSLAAYSSLTEAYEDDLTWLENVVNAPRATFNVNRWNSRNKRHSANMDELLLQNLMLNKFYSQEIRNSRRKRNIWFTDDPGNRATDTVTTRAPTFAPSSQTTTTESVTTTATTAAPPQNIPPVNIPVLPPSFWGRVRVPIGWGKRRRRSVMVKKHKDEYESD